jgi:putative protease
MTQPNTPIPHADPSAPTAAPAAPIAAPELLAPAGDWECAAAAIENGADAIYFGLDCGFNARARARAKNFHLHDLPQLMTMLHRRGVAGYVTLNTLAFASELPAMADVIARVAAAGVDAVLVQDLGPPARSWTSTPRRR